MESVFQKIVAMMCIPLDALADVHDACMSAGPTKTTLWTFPWEKKVLVNDKEVLLREIVNSLEFQEYLGTLLSYEPYYTASIHLLEHDCKVVYCNGDVNVERDDAILIATFSPCCDECGMKTVNGHMTCICWADEEDLARMRRL